MKAVGRHGLLIAALAMLAMALALFIFLLSATAIDAAPADGKANGDCIGFTWDRGVVTGVSGKRVYVSISGNTGVRWTLGRWSVGDAVEIRGFACFGKLDGLFQMRRAQTSALGS